MDNIRTVGKGMEVLSKRQVILLEINALSILTHDRAMNKAEVSELKDISTDDLMGVPFNVRLQYGMCDCFVKHKWN